MFIRAKDEIFEVTKDTKGRKFIVVGKNKTLLDYETFIHSESDIISQSENLAKLCDVFVVEDTLNNVRYFEDYDDLVEEISYGSLHPATIVYGAIWVEIKLQNGKIIHKPEPVTLLNENGDFELIFINNN